MSFKTPPPGQTYLVPSPLANQATLAAGPPLFMKPVAAVALLTFDFSAVIAVGGTISGSQTLSVSGSSATFGTPALDTGSLRVQAMLSGGTAGDTAECKAVVTDTESQTLLGACLVGIIANT